jgi:dTDP-4-dehydrorhamnose 3,5-epimerase
MRPTRHVDARGSFLEWYRHDRLEQTLGHAVRIAQANLSVSGTAVVRGCAASNSPSCLQDRRSM